jgi:hypothetical protein
MTRPSVLLVFALLAGTDGAAVAEPPSCVDGSSPEMKGVPYIGTREGGWFGALDVKPGETRTLQIYVRQGPATAEPRACVRWTLSPNAPASIDPDKGVLTIDRHALHGGAITVVAQVPGVPVLQAVFHVYDPNRNRLAGKWTQVAPPSCRKGETEVIRELEIRADGTFSVTWHPFETYVDYWGSYLADEKDSTVRFSIADGNFVPKNFQGNGRFSVDAAGHLRLENVWFGRTGDRESTVSPAGCSYEFVRD